MKKKNILDYPPCYKNSKNKILLLSDIVKKHIVSVKIAYLSEKKIVNTGGIFGFFVKEKTIQEKLEITINDKEIFFDYTPGVEFATICFSNKDEFLKLTNYDSNTIWKRNLMTISWQYQINFLISNLKEIDWV